MKKVLVLTATLLLALTSGRPARAESGSLKDTKYLGGGLGIDLPLQNWSPVYAGGGGLEVQFGYYFDENLVFQLEAASYLWPGDSNKMGGILTNITDARITPGVKILGGGNGMKPYGLVAAGLDVSTVNFVMYNTTEKSADVLLGAGLQFDLDPKTWLFVEGRYNLTFMNAGTRQDFPFLAGLLFSL